MSNKRENEVPNKDLAAGKGEKMEGVKEWKYEKYENSLFNFLLKIYFGK